MSVCCVCVCVHMHRGIRNSFSSTKYFAIPLHDENIIMKMEQMYNKMIMKSIQRVSSCEFYEYVCVCVCVCGRAGTKTLVSTQFQKQNDSVMNSVWVHCRRRRRQITETIIINLIKFHRGKTPSFKAINTVRINLVHKHISKNYKWISSEEMFKNRILHLLTHVSLGEYEILCD